MAPTATSSSTMPPTSSGLRPSARRKSPRSEPSSRSGSMAAALGTFSHLHLCHDAVLGPCGLGNGQALDVRHPALAAGLLAIERQADRHAGAGADATAD